MKSCRIQSAATAALAVRIESNNAVSMYRAGFLSFVVLSKRDGFFVNHNTFNDTVRIYAVGSVVMLVLSGLKFRGEEK